MNYPTTQSSLLERVQNGDEISWNEFYFRYAPVIRAAGAGSHYKNAECDDNRIEQIQNQNKAIWTATDCEPYTISIYKNY